MTFKVSDELISIYKENKRNTDVAISFLLDSFDPKTFEKAFQIVKEIAFPTNNHRKELDIGEKVCRKIKAAFQIETIPDDLISGLLWIAILFPEI